ncbi:MAG TPA: GAF domain-containing sensor histidine kinase [Steroidobacteraceae bacterium]|nr:GAF domain-containing sensor histidine kinase [Steroidobacteraceae bacterium]
MNMSSAVELLDGEQTDASVDTRAALVTDTVLPCADKLAEINESLHHRDSLLASSAKASRMLLEAPDVMDAVPAVLRLLGESADADRVNLMLAKSGPNGERWLVVTSEWVASGVAPHLGHPSKGTCDEQCLESLANELRAGRSVCINSCQLASGRADFDGVGTQSKAVVPIFVDSEFLGVVGFDNTRQRRDIDFAELSALETAAGVIGAALHRERLIDAVRRERELAAEQRVAELARANAAIRANLERLAKEPDLHSFLGHVLLEATRQLDAAGGLVAVRDPQGQWRLKAKVKDGNIELGPLPALAPATQADLNRLLSVHREPFQMDVVRNAHELWPEALDYMRRHGHTGFFMLPLQFGERTVGCVGLVFSHNEPVGGEHSELLVALAQQATLAIELMRLARTAQDAAVLVERNRIGQEIHDGLAQAFTGILMQLGAAEELEVVTEGSPLATICARVKDLAREGLAEARRSVMALRPDQTRRNGLEQALRQLCDRSTVPGRTTCTFDGGELETGLPPEHEHELLRIAQEAVSNAVRHGKPRNVRISMSGGPTGLVLSVADDGRGLEKNPERCAQQGFGLTSMRERATAIGGHWHIDSRPGEGTRVTVRVAARRVAQ